MTKTSKWIVGIIVVILVVWGGYSYFKKPVSGEPIKIGFISLLSGEGANYGETEKNITSLAIEDINSSGGINGRQIEVIYEDGKCAGKDAVTAIQKLINIDKVKIVFGGFCSSETLAIAPVAEENKVILFSSFSSNPAITESGDYIFRNCPSDSYAGKLDAETIVKKYKKVAMISENTDYSLGVRGVMKKIFEEKNIEIVADEIYNSSVSDFRTILLSKIKTSGAEVIYVNPGTSPKTGGIIVKQAREMGIKTPIHGNYTLGTPEALAIGGGFMEGVVISDSLNQEENFGEQLKNLLARYKNSFNSEVAHAYLAGAAWDRVQIIKDAIKKVGYNPDKIKNYIYGIKNYDGMVGNYYFDENGDVVGNFFNNFIIQVDGTKVPYKE